MKFKKALSLIVGLTMIFNAVIIMNKVLSNIIRLITHVFVKGLPLEIFKYLGVGILEVGVLIFAISVSGKFLKNIKDWLWEEEE